MTDLIRTLVSHRLDDRTRLLLGQLVMFTGIAALFPIAPLYVRQHGGNSLDVALFIAGPMVANTLVQVPAGHLVDRIGRKPVLIGSRLVYATFAFALFLNLGPLWLLGLFRAVQGASGGAYVPALRAALADLTPADRRSEQYAQLQAVEMVGLLVGPAIGGLVAIWTYSAVFLCAGLGTLLGVTALFRMQEPSHQLRAEDTVEPPPGWWRSRSIVVPSIALACAGTLFAMYDTVWPQYMAARHASTVLIGLSISLFALPVIFLATRAGRVSDRGNRRLIVAGSFLLVACTALLYPELFTFPVIIAVGMVEAVGFMFAEPNLFAFLSDSTNSSARGRAMGVGGFAQFAGGAFGAGCLGALYGVSPSLPFLCGSAACILGAILCFTLLPRTLPGPQDASGMPQIAAVELETQL
jgi:MFS family permease